MSDICYLISFALRGPKAISPIPHTPYPIPIIGYWLRVTSYALRVPRCRTPDAGRRFFSLCLFPDSYPILNFLNLISDVGHLLSDIICSARAEGHFPHTPYPIPHTYIPHTLYPEPCARLFYSPLAKKKAAPEIRDGSIACILCGQLRVLVKDVANTKLHCVC
jgi:hypothetical protein